MRQKSETKIMSETNFVSDPRQKTMSETNFVSNRRQRRQKLETKNHIRDKKGHIFEGKNTIALKNHYLNLSEISPASSQQRLPGRNMHD
jgi:hypothetical protein